MGLLDYGQQGEKMDSDSGITVGIIITLYPSVCVCVCWAILTVILNELVQIFDSRVILWPWAEPERVKRQLRVEYFDVLICVSLWLHLKYR